MGFQNSIVGVKLSHNAEDAEFLKLWCKKITDELGNEISLDELKNFDSGDINLKFELYSDIITEDDENYFVTTTEEFFCNIMPVMKYTQNQNITIQACMCFQNFFKRNQKPFLYL